MAAAPLRVGIVENDPPYSFTQEHEAPGGLLVELWRYWGRINQRDIEFVTSASYTQAVGEVLAGHTDLLAGMDLPLQSTPQLVATEFAIDDPVHLFTHLSLGQISAWEQVKPYRIAVNQQFRLSPDLLPTGYAFNPYESREAQLEAIRRGDVRAALNRKISGNFYFHSERIPFRINGLLKLIDNQRVAMVKAGNPDLLQQVNDGVKRLDSQYVRAIVSAWSGTDQDDNMLTITMPLWTPPYSVATPEGEVIGLLPDLWRLWAQKTGAQIRFLGIDSKHADDMVTRGLADILGATLTPLPARMSRLSYPTSLFPLKLGVYVPESSAATRLSDLGNEPIAIFGSSIVPEPLRDRAPDIQFEYKGPFSAMTTAMQGAFLQSPAIMENPAVPLLKEGQRYRLLNDSLVDETILVAIPRFRTELAALVRQGMEQISTRELAQLEKKWLSNPRDRYFDASPSFLPLGPDSQRWVEENPVVRVGLASDASTSSQSLEFHDDLIQLLGDYLPVRFESRLYTDKQSLLDALQQGDMDMVVNTGGVTDTLVPFHYSSAYANTPWVIVTHSSHLAFRSINDLRGQTLSVLSGASVIEQLHGYPELDFIEVASLQEGLESISDGRAEGYVGNLAALTQYLQQSGQNDLNLHRVPELKDDQLRFAMRDDWPEFSHMVNRVIKMTEEHELKQLREKWLSLQIQYGINERDLWVERLKIAGGAALVVIFILLWNRRLRQEIVRRKIAEKEVRHLATHDTLTGLPNRLLLRDRIAKALDTAKRNQQKVALLFIDLDGFKAVNDSLGHDAGDELLKGVAQRIHSTLRESDTVARIGGDEFVVLLPEISHRDGAAQVAENLLQHLGEPYQLAQEAHIGASIGIALYPDTARDADELLSVADNLMYQVKKSGKNSYAFA